MFRWALRKGIDTFEREWNHDATHIRDMTDACPDGNLIELFEPAR